MIDPCQEFGDRRLDGGKAHAAAGRRWRTGRSEEDDRPYPSPQKTQRPGEIVLMEPNGFPKHPFDAIPVNRSFHAAGNGESDLQSRVGRFFQNVVQPHWPLDKQSAVRNDRCEGAISSEDIRSAQRLTHEHVFAARAATYRLSLTVSRFRPALRRRLSTLRPFFVAMRARNPWVLRRFRRWG